MEEETKRKAEVVVLALIERFEDIEEETGANFHFAKKIILRWARDKKLFDNF